MTRRAFDVSSGGIGIRSRVSTAGGFEIRGIIMPGIGAKEIVFVTEVLSRIPAMRYSGAVLVLAVRLR